MAYEPVTGTVQDVFHGHALDLLGKIDEGSIQCCVTSPPYFGLRKYGEYEATWPDGWTGELGTETTVVSYVQHLVHLFGMVRSCLSKDGVLFLNISDSYAGSGKGWGGGSISEKMGHYERVNGTSEHVSSKPILDTCKPKDMFMVPSRLAMALRDDGWYLRQDIIWKKSPHMPESVKDRPVSCYEHIYMLSKSAVYKYHDDKASDNIWTFPPSSGEAGHSATFPVELPYRCIQLASDPGDYILDPFSGTGTTCVAARRLGRNAIGLEINKDWVEHSKKRLLGDSPMFSQTQLALI